MHEKSQTAFREFHQFFNFILNSVIDNVLASLSNMTNYFLSGSTNEKFC